jgi:hypothetical protein
MSLLDRILTRRRFRPLFSSLSLHVRSRFARACQELTEAEEAIAEQLGLPAPPRLVMIDEETAAIILPRDRLEHLSAEELPDVAGNPPAHG